MKDATSLLKGAVFDGKANGFLCRFKLRFQSFSDYPKGFAPSLIGPFKSFFFRSLKLRLRHQLDGVAVMSDMRPRAIIEQLDLLRPIYKKTAAYGHFGRELPEFSWEKTDKAAILKEKAGI